MSNSNDMNNFKDELKKIDEKIVLPGSLKSENLMPLLDGVVPDEFNESKADKIVRFFGKYSFAVAAVFLFAVGLPISLKLYNNAKSMPELANDMTAMESSAAEEEAPQEEEIPQAGAYLKSSRGVENYQKAETIEDLRNMIALAEKNSEMAEITEENDSVELFCENGMDSGKNIVAVVCSEVYTFSAFVNEIGYYSVDILENDEIKNTVDFSEAYNNFSIFSDNSLLYVAYDKELESNSSDSGSEYINSYVTALEIYDAENYEINPLEKFNQDGFLDMFYQNNDGSISLCTIKPLPPQDVREISDEDLLPATYNSDMSEKFNLSLDKIDILSNITNISYRIHTVAESKEDGFTFDTRAILE